LHKIVSKPLKEVRAIDRQSIFEEIEKERERQDKLHPLGKIKIQDPELLTVAEYIRMNEFLAVLIEEIGEVGKALQGEGELKDELIQVASVCVKWLEHLKAPVVR
jgi:hypothetical protein